MWRTSKGLMQERIVMPDTGLEKIVSVKIKGNGLKAEQDAVKRLTERIEHLSDKRIRLTEAMDIYLKESEKTLKPSSIRKIHFELKAFVEIVGDAYLDSLTAGYIRKKLLDSGRPNRTLNGYIKIFKTFWKWAYINDYVKTNEVYDKLTRFQDTPQKERIQDKYLEPEELNRLLSAMTEERHRLMFEFLVLSGLRIGEAICLTKSDVMGKEIHVTKTYDSNNRVVNTTKTYSSKRDIFIQDELRDCINRINEYVSRQEEVFGKSMLFFPDANGGYYPYPTFSKYLREVSERVLHRRCTPHITRHTHASMLFARGMDLQSVSSRLGHEDSQITKDIYLHRMEELKERENNQLNMIRLIG